MKKTLTIAFALIMAVSLLFAFSPNEDGNGQLTKESAKQWATSANKCGTTAEIQEVENGYIVKCDTEFQGLPGVFSDEFILMYAADPAKRFHIDVN